MSKYLNYWDTIEFADKQWLLLLILPLLFLVWQIWRYQQLYPVLKLPILSGLGKHASPWRGWLKRHLYVLRILAVGSLIFAMARPQFVQTEDQIETEGIDIVIALDISSSMTHRDFQPNRLEAAKKKASEFIQARADDRVGLVVFAKESFTQCPLTTDTIMIQQLLREIRSGLIEDGTAIGMGLGTAINRLKESTAESKVVILLTDGENNAGKIQPMMAVEAAKTFGIRIYTIGVGRRGKIPVQVQGLLGTKYVYQEVKIDEELLQEIAKQTDGKYFRATDNEALENIYESINELETSRIEMSKLTRRSEAFYLFLILGASLFLLELLLRYTLVRNIP